jgi:EAL domain-containing protein (putative c-di-GMP-specific phosphodiesterase class I)
MADVDGSIVRLGALRDLGTRIAIDDFGIGHSSLAYVHRLPIDAIKIDRSFTHRITDHPDAARLVHSIILLTHSLELDAVAEGVETSQQLTMLKQMGCDYAQGFHLGTPAPPEHITTMLEGEEAPRQRRPTPARRSAASSPRPVLKVVAGQAPG